MYTKCVHAATNLSEDIECTEFSSSQIIKELKKENATLLRRIDKLKQDISDYRKLKNKLQSLHNLV
jgi:cell division protein FtsB